MHKNSMGDVKAVQSVFTLLGQKMVTTDSEKIGPLFHIFSCDPKKLCIFMLTEDVRMDGKG